MRIAEPAQRAVFRPRRARKNGGARGQTRGVRKVKTAAVPRPNLIRVQVYGNHELKPAQSNSTQHVRQCQMSDPIEDLQRIVDSYAGKDDVIDLLEAGCGSTSRVRLSNKFRVTGIDISQEQLSRNTGLSVRILGDVQNYKFAKNSFDMIVCWDVIEHLDKPALALGSFFRAIKPGGLIILAYPNLYSIKGTVTKITPHYLHVLYYKYLLHRPDAGLNDTAPFVTPFRLDATYPRIKKMCIENNAKEVYFVLRESSSMKYVRKNFRIFDIGFGLASIASRAISLGRVDLTHSDCIQVLQAAPST